MKRVKVLLLTPPKRRMPRTPEIPDLEWVPAEYLDCFDDPLINFLTQAWQARGIWRSMIGRLPDNRKAELDELKTGCESLLIHLEREHFSATSALGITASDSASFRNGHARYLSLLEMLRSISGAVSHSGKWLESGLIGESDEDLRDRPSGVHPYAYAPQDVENREQIYVSRFLSEHTQKTFGLLHHEAVAITIAVLFELDDRKGKLAGTVEERWKTNPI
jgi:hypothetical protein